MNVKGEFEELEDVYNSMLVRVSQLTSSLHAQEIATKDAELASLYAQINPHFYTILLTVLMVLFLCRKNGSTGSYYFFEQIIKVCHKRKKYCSPEKELEYVRNYLFIEKIRYQNKLLVLIDVPEELHAYTIPKLTLQPLIENAIIHGFHNSLNEVIIAVTADSDENLLFYT